MSNLSDKVSYLRGLAEGMKLDESTNEGRLIKEIIAVLGEMVEQVDELSENVEELGDYVECIDDDLEALEVRADEDEDFDDDDDFHFIDDDDDDDFDEDEEDDECDCDCECCHGSCEDEDEDEDEAFGMYAGCLCSECGGMFSVDVSCEEEQLFICPHCGKRVKAVQMNCTNVPVAETVDEDEGTDEE